MSVLICNWLTVVTKARIGFTSLNLNPCFVRKKKSWVITCKLLEKNKGKPYANWQHLMHYPNLQGDMRNIEFVA